jgi:undecaprenyl pyrophosphate synthase
MNVSTPLPLNRSQRMPRHIAVIMDGNGRWATTRGRPRTFGHASGARAVKRTVEAARLSGGQFTREQFSKAMAAAAHAPGGVPDVDLLIRTGGEQRLSDFLLWECAYAELVFTPRMWPEFAARDLEAAITEFQRRERRFGDVGDDAPTAAIGSA